MAHVTSGNRIGRRALLGGLAATTTAAVVAGPAQAAAGPGHATAGPGQPVAGPGQAATGSGERQEERNKRRVADVFRRAAERGTLNQENEFYLDILHPDVGWTVSAMPASTYTGRADFLTRGAAPVLRRLATPIIPAVRELHADGDTVVAVFDGTATALDGEPYVNTYAWIFTMRGRQAIRVRAFLDLVTLDELLTRVPLPGQDAKPDRVGRPGRVGTPGRVRTPDRAGTPGPEGTPGS